MAEKPYTRSDLEKLLCEEMGVNQITPLLTKHINELCLSYKMTFKEIARCIFWYVEIAKGKMAIQYGIKSVCTSVREKANQYFQQLELDQQKQRAEARKVVQYQENNIIFNISSLPHKKREPKQLDINDIEVGGSNENHN